MIEGYLIPGGRSALVNTDRDRKHRPYSHPLIGGPRPSTVTDTTPPWDGAALRRQRVAVGWSQKQLADALAVTRVAVSWWESGQPPSAKHREAIEHLLGEIRP